MKNRKLVSLLLALCMVLGMTAGALAADDAAEGTASGIVVLFTNDVHCGVEDGIGYAGLAAYAAEMRETYGEENVILVDAGDAIQGAPIGTLSAGGYLVDIMGEVGYSLAVPGNHEFDYRVERLVELAESAEYQYLCCNLVDLTTEKPLFDAYKLVEFGDVTVGFVGISTPNTFSSSTPAYFQNEDGEYIYSFCQGGDGEELYTAVQKAIDDTKAAGADIVIAIGHLGVGDPTSVWNSTDVIANTTGLSAFIDGHSHSVVNSTTAEEPVTDKDGNEVALAQTGTKFANIGKLVIDPETLAVTVELISECETKDETIAAFIGDIKSQYQDLTNTIVAHTDVTLLFGNKNVSEEYYIRMTETNLGDLCADAYRVMGNADVAFMNGGGIRAQLPVDHTDPDSNAYIEGAVYGDITYGDILTVFPYSNYLSVVKATGQQIVDLLEAGVAGWPAPKGGFQHVSGLSFVIDRNVPTGVKTNDEGEFVGVEGEYRVKNVKVDGEPIDLEKTYIVASHNYLLDNAGDGMVMFKGCESVVKGGTLDSQMLINYIVDELGGVIGEGYGNMFGAGRIVVKNYTDVELDAEGISTIDRAYELKIMVGDGDGNFRPDDVVTAAELCQTLYNISDRPEVETDSTEWFAPAMTWAAANELYTGADAEAEISEADFAEVLGLFAEFSERTYDLGETDGSTLTRAELAAYLVAFVSAR